MHDFVLVPLFAVTFPARGSCLCHALSWVFSSEIWRHLCRTTTTTNVPCHPPTAYLACIAEAAGSARDPKAPPTGPLRRLRIGQLDQVPSSSRTFSRPASSPRDKAIQWVSSNATSTRVREHPLTAYLSHPNTRVDRSQTNGGATIRAQSMGHGMIPTGNNGCHLGPTGV